MTKPIRCLVETPHSHSVDFAGTHINLKALARASGVHHTYLSRVFGGLLPLPRIETARRMADALGMEFGDFIEALEDRAGRQLHKKLRVREEYERQKQERRAEIAARRKARQSIQA